MAVTEHTPSVGIFWFVPGEYGDSILLADMTPIGKAPDYGDLKTHDRGHHEYWTSLARMGATRLRQLDLPPLIASTPYETYPRPDRLRSSEGRVPDLR
ncbi:MAG: hypothetical protein ABI395_05410 [Sphingobium sp.]